MQRGIIMPTMLVASEDRLRENTNQDPSKTRVSRIC